MAQANATGWEPVESGASGWEPVDSAQPATPALDLSQQGNEGSYPMRTPSGETKPVPFSRVKTAIAAGYAMDPKTLARWHSDVRAIQPKWYEPGSGNGPMEFLKGGAAGIIGTIEHPKGILQPAIDALPAYQNVNGVPLPIPNREGIEHVEQQVQSAREHPTYTAGEVIIPAALTAGAEKVIDLAPSAARPIVEGATGTGPRETGKLVESTKKANTRIEDINAKRAEMDTKKAAKVEQENAATVEAAKQKAATDRAEELRDYLRKKQTVTAENSARQSVADRKVALERGVEHLDPELKGELEKTRDAVNAEANAKYNALQKELGTEQAAPYQPRDDEGNIDGEPQTITERLYDVATGPLRGTETESAIIKSLGKRVETGETTLTYNDLQGYREEIGKELRKGTLPPDTFTAYKNLMPAIDDAMQEIADRKGLGKAQTEARNYYRRYAETFLDKSSPVRKALDSEERGGVVKALRGKDQSGIEAVAQFNPELARRLNTVRGYAEEATATKPTAARKPEPTLPPKPQWVEPKLKPVPEARPATPTKKIGSADVQAAKESGLHKAADLIRKRGTSIAVYVTGYRSLAAVARAAMGDTHALAGLPADVGEGIALVGGAHAFARMLESPRVIEMLTKPTARDLAQIPPELRGDLGPVVQQAQAHGIKVSPLLIAAIGGSQSPVGPKTQQLQKIRDGIRAGGSETMVETNPKGLVEAGNLPIWNRPTIQNADGSHSSELSISMGDDQGREVLIPTIADGKFMTPDGKMPPLVNGKVPLAEDWDKYPQWKALKQAAWDRFQKTGENLGKFDNADDADAYATKLHNRGARPSQ